MYVFHVTARVAAGHEAQYEAWKVAEGEIQRVAPGFIKRVLLRDSEERGVYYYISFWETEEQCRDFAATPQFRALHTQHDPGATFTQPMLRHQCDLIFEDLGLSR